MDMELVLHPDDRRIDDQRDRIALRRLAAGAIEERARAPCGFEIVRRLGRAQERVFDADDPPGRDQDRVVRQRRTHDDMAARLAAREIDAEAGEGRAGQLVIGDAGAHDLPQSHAVKAHGDAAKRRGRRDGGGHGQNPCCLCAARHGSALRIALEPFYERAPAPPPECAVVDDMPANGRE